MNGLRVAAGVPACRPRVPAHCGVGRQGRLPLRRTYIVIAPMAACFLLGACASAPQKPAAVLAEGALVPSPRLIVGRVIAVDAARRHAIVELGGDAPAAAATEGAELMTRTEDLRETSRLRASRQLRGRILGATVASGQPAQGDEVVWLAP